MYYTYVHRARDSLYIYEPSICILHIGKLYKYELLKCERNILKIDIY